MRGWLFVDRPVMTSADAAPESAPEPPGRGAADGHRRSAGRLRAPGGRRPVPRRMLTPPWPGVGRRADREEGEEEDQPQEAGLRVAHPGGRLAGRGALRAGFPDPGLLHPVGVDGPDAGEERPGPGEQAVVQAPRRPPGRHRRLHRPARRRHRPGERSDQAGRRPARARRSRVGTGSIFINNKPIDEPYLPPDVRSRDFPPEKVPPARVWVLGDNRQDSRDSTFFKSIDEHSIVGRAFVKIWPLNDLSLL